MTILALATQIVGLIPTLIMAGVNVVGLVNNVRNVIDENRVPNNAEWDALDAQVRDLQKQFRDASA